MVHKFWGIFYWKSPNSYKTKCPSKWVSTNYDFRIHDEQALLLCQTCAPSAGEKQISLTTWEYSITFKFLKSLNCYFHNVSQMSLENKAGLLCWQACEGVANKLNAQCLEKFVPWLDAESGLLIFNVTRAACS